MKLELCDVCKEKEPNKKLKVKMSRKGYYERIDGTLQWVKTWSPYKKVVVCDVCYRKLLNAEVIA